MIGVIKLHFLNTKLKSFPKLKRICHEQFWNENQQKKDM